MGDIITDQTRLEKQKPYTESSHESKTGEPFMFHHISLIECKRLLRTLKKTHWAKKHTRMGAERLPKHHC